MSRKLIWYSRLRSATFALQYWTLNRISTLIGFQTPVNYKDTQILLEIKSELDQLIEADVKRIEQGYYPASVLRPNNLITTLTTLPKVLLDGLKVGHRRTKKSSSEFTDKAKEYFDDLPSYYLRNFHYQTDGYLSHSSAEVYEYEVELLFSGATDAMRRLIIAPLKDTFKDSPDGKGLKFLEIGSGTGRATRFVKLAFPKAKIIAVDLSEPYLKLAEKNLRKLKNLNFLQGNGADLPFKDQEFDAVYSVFLFHEMPKEVRKSVLKESTRVLKCGGFLGFVDSIQKGDFPGFDKFLDDFPKNFHEPFYLNYIRSPMLELLKQLDLEKIEMGRGLLAKFGYGRKCNAPNPKT